MDLHARIFPEFFKWLTSFWKLTNENICYLFVFYFCFFKVRTNITLLLLIKAQVQYCQKSIETWKHTVKGTLKVSHKSAVFQKEPFIRLFSGNWKSCIIRRPVFCWLSLHLPLAGCLCLCLHCCLIAPPLLAHEQQDVYLDLTDGSLPVPAIRGTSFLFSYSCLTYLGANSCWTGMVWMD